MPPVGTGWKCSGALKSAAAVTRCFFVCSLLRWFMADASVAVAAVAACLQEVYAFVSFHFMAFRHRLPLASYNSLAA